MSRKQCRRKHYPMMNTISMAIEGAAITPDAALNKLQLRELASLDALARAKAGFRNGEIYVTSTTWPRPWL